MSLFAELKRRNVLRAGVLYIGAIWALAQGISQLSPAFDVPAWFTRWFVIAGVIGFPFAMLFSWFYEWTPQGIRRESELAASDAVRGTGRRFDAAIIGVLALAVVLLVTDRFIGHGGAAGGVNDKSIAVLPFANLSQDADNAYFAIGMQDEILTKLAKIASLRVISRTSTMHFASSPDNLPEIARKLGVAAVLEGSVQKRGDKVHVNVQLIRAASDEHLWAESYDRSLSDVFAVQGEVAQAVAEALRAKLTGSEQTLIAEKPTSNLPAYEAYLRGLAQEGRFSSTDADIRARADAYRAAVELDPGFAKAWAGLSRAQVELQFNDPSGNKAHLQAAKEALDQALRLAPDDADTLQAQGSYLYAGVQDFDGALRAFTRALQQRPNDGLMVYQIGNVRRRQGYWNAALAPYERATQLDPMATNTWFNLGMTLRALRRYDEAQSAFDRGLAVAPNDPALIAEKATTYVAIGDQAGAARVFAALAPEAYRDTAMAVARFRYLSLPHDVHEDIRLFEAALRDRAALGGTAFIYLYALGGAELLAGDRDAGMAHLRESLVAYDAGRGAGAANPWFQVPMARVAALLGERERAYRDADAAAQALAHDAIGQPAALEAQAYVRMLGGDKADAVAFLRQMQALPIPYGDTIATLRVDPAWNPLLDDAGFQALLAAGDVPLQVKSPPP